MLHERYSIEVSDYCVEVYGEITIREAFDLIHYFDQQGYTHLTIGHENSTMRIIKHQIQDPKEPPNLYEVLLKDQEKTNQQLRSVLKQKEQFIKMLLTIDSESVRKLELENRRLCSELSRKKFETNPEALKIINQEQKEDFNLHLPSNEETKDEQH